MGALNQRSKIKAPAPIIRIEQVPVNPKPRPKPLTNGSANGLNAAGGTRTPHTSPKPRSSSGGGGLIRGDSKSKSASPYPSSADDDSRLSRKRKAGGATNSRSPASENVMFSDDSDSEDDEWEKALVARKRRRQERVVDRYRKLRHSQLWSGEEAGTVRELAIIHAADLASLKGKCQPLLGLSADENDVAIEVRYPGTRQRERYQLVSGKDKINGVKDIMAVINFVADNYLNDEDAQPFLDPSTGIYRRLQRASSDNVQDGPAFKAAVKEYNKRLIALQKNGTISKNINNMHSLPKDIVAFILDQVYDRTVAVKVELLAKYENGSDNVYGELLHDFITDFLVERTKMTSEQVFVDLGSGVGNVVLQAALQVGCESWGCEMMQNACDLADAQLKEFTARCQLWGVAPGKVHLERGDFRKNARISDVLKRADVVLVNNQAFTSQLNDNLVSMFLDLKPGCKIISLKSFVHEHKSASNDVATSILDVEKFTYPEGSVSWTGAGGDYCISTRR